MSGQKPDIACQHSVVSANEDRKFLDVLCFILVIRIQVVVPPGWRMFLIAIGAVCDVTVVHF